MCKLTKVGIAAALGLALCLSLLSSGVFAQSVQQSGNSLVATTGSQTPQGGWNPAGNLPPPGNGWQGDHSPGNDWQNGNFPGDNWQDGGFPGNGWQGNPSPGNGDGWQNGDFPGNGWQDGNAPGDNWQNSGFPGNGWCGLHAPCPQHGKIAPCAPAAQWAGSGHPAQRVLRPVCHHS